MIGTPSFFINQMAIPGLGSDSSAKQWAAYLDKLAGPPKLRAAAPDSVVSSSPYPTASMSRPAEGTSVLTVVGFFMMVAGMVAWMAAKRGFIRSRILESDIMMEMRGTNDSGSGERSVLVRDGNCAPTSA